MEQKPQLSRENLLLNELIREYLEYNNYLYTRSVLTAGQWPSDSLPVYIMIMYLPNAIL